MFTVACPNCRQFLNAPEELLGRQAKCPTCGGIISVTAPAARDQGGFQSSGDATAIQTEPTPRPASDGTKACPVCGETIKAVALVCRFCKADLGVGEARRGQGVWRHGGQLVMRKDALLPARCVKTNEPTDRWLRRQLFWHTPALYIMIVFPGLLFYIIAALLFRKTADIKVGLSPTGFSRRR